jgi:hypothetical protein
MKNYLIILCVLIFGYSFSQTACDKASDMVATIEKFHCEPRPIDSSFSEMFCDILLKKVDGHGLFLSGEDIDNYNNAVEEYNKAAGSMNETNEEMNKSRSEMLDKWNESVEDFFKAHS